VACTGRSGKEGVLKLEPGAAWTREEGSTRGGGARHRRREAAATAVAWAALGLGWRRPEWREVLLQRWPGTVEVARRGG
jgi:hypothetical protein